MLAWNLERKELGQAKGKAITLKSETLESARTRQERKQRECRKATSSKLHLLPSVWFSAEISMRWADEMAGLTRSPWECHDDRDSPSSQLPWPGPGLCSPALGTSAVDAAAAAGWGWTAATTVALRSVAGPPPCAAARTAPWRRVAVCTGPVEGGSRRRKSPAWACWWRWGCPSGWARARDFSVAIEIEHERE